VKRRLGAAQEIGKKKKARPVIRFQHSRAFAAGTFANVGRICGAGLAKRLIRSTEPRPGLMTNFEFDQVTRRAGLILELLRKLCDLMAEP
jgi:hypothetical protein